MARPKDRLLIRDAELLGGKRADVLVVGGRIAGIGRGLPDDAQQVREAKGGLLLPGLHDHHVHLAGLAARRHSVWCGPPQVEDEATLREVLAQAPGSGWIRGLGYHESVLSGLPDARALDLLVADRPLRLQHRSGRMWLLNSLALDLLLAENDPSPGLERGNGCFTGRLFNADEWLRAALGSNPPDFSLVSAELASFGVTGLTDMTPQNGPAMAAHFAGQRENGELMQSVMLAGTLDLAHALQTGWALGPVKMHLHEANLPPFDDAVALIRQAHEQARAVAIHCVSEVELVFALAALEEVGAMIGDRIEHASVTAPGHIAQITDLGLAVCVQPHFIFERGDRYLLDVEASSHPHLYRLAGLSAAGIPLAGGSDAPFASVDPWSAMRSAVSRQTIQGSIIGASEALSPEATLALSLADPTDFSRQREVREGTPADLCLLSRPWSQARERLTSEDVVLTVASGQIVYDLIDQTPVQRGSG